MPSTDTNPDPILRSLEGQEAWQSLLVGLAVGLLGLWVQRRWWRLADRMLPEAAAPTEPPSGAVVLACGLVFLLAGPLFSLPQDLGAVERLRAALRGSLSLLALTGVVGLVVQWGAGGRAAALGFRWARPLAAPPLALGTWLSLWPLLFAMAELQLAWYGFRGLEVPTQEAVEVIHSSPELAGDWWFLGGVILLQPCLEELIYRGILLSYLRRFLGPLAAVLVDSCLFALVHDAGEPQVFVLSVGMGLLYLRTGSLLAPCLLHILHNGVTVALFLLPGGPS